MSSKDQLVSKLRNFAQNLRAFKRLFEKYPPSDKNLSIELERTQEQTKEFNEIITPSNRLIDQILKIFRSLYEQSFGNVGIDKLKKQFDYLLKQYKDNLKKYEQLERKEVEAIRKTMTKQLQKVRRSKLRASSVKESERVETAKIEMLQVNQQTLNCELMIEIKQKQIKIAHERMKDALRVHEDMKNLVVHQGEKLNEVEANIVDANRNVHEALENLVEAQKQHISSKKKMMCIVGIVVIVLLIIVIPIVIHFN